ncbi:MAG TPA: NAD(P)H-binding protein [Mycobacteriales bacterium]|nr:NAD(P)H-binding protein [Mycobacteriales bacterium]
MRVAVAGGTGVVGRHVVDALRDRGHEPVVLARSTGVDIYSGVGLDEGLVGAQVLIDVSDIDAIRRAACERFFRTSTSNLVEAGRRAGVEHLVVLSIVGSDRVDLGYYMGKRVQESVALEGRLPASVLRATQFHEFPSQLLDRAPRGPAVPVPRMRSQTVAAKEVAQVLVDVALAAPIGMAGDVAGPEAHEMADLVRKVLRSRGSRRIVIQVPLPGAAGKKAASGALLPTGEFVRGRQTFAEWLEAQTP